MAKPTHSMMGPAGARGGDGSGAHGDWTDRPAERVAAGSVLGGKYRLIAEIGRGGMGAVWRAEHLGWEAPVAVKIMNRDITAHPEALARFEREVRLAAGLRSPHVVQVLDHGIDEDTATPFIAMELLDGESLARRLKRLDCLSAAETFHVFSEVVRALTRAHAAGIVHRDLKPDNIFLVRNDDESLTKILDFGVAKWTVPDISESGLTRPGSVVGTPFYMSPEQIQGSREIDHRADLWALAAIACECLTGRRPFEAPDFAQLAVLLLGNTSRPLPSSLGPVPPGFDAWFLRATDPDIRRRFQTAREMAQALAPICDAAAPSSSSGEDAPVPRGGASTWQEHPPSMAPVSNTASRILFSPSLWQRPMVKLIATTAATTLVVTGAFAFWLLGRTDERRLPGAPPAAPMTGAVPPALLTHAPSLPSTHGATGPNVRPIREDVPPPASTEAPPPAGSSEPRPPAAQDAPGPGPRDPDTLPGDGARNNSPRSDSPRSDGPDALRARVRAAQLHRLERPRRRTRVSTPARSSERAPEATTAAPEAAAPPPQRPASAPAEPSKSEIVDGRRIRTSL